MPRIDPTSECTRLFESSIAALWLGSGFSKKGISPSRVSTLWKSGNVICPVNQPRLIALGVSKHKPTSCPKFFKHPALIGQMRVQPPMLLLLVNRWRICGTVSRSITIIGAVHLGHCHATGRGGPPLPGESMTADNCFPRMWSNPIRRAIKSGTCPANCGRS